MVDKNEKNIIFSRLVTEIIEDKYDIVFSFTVTYVEDNWSNLSVIRYLLLYVHLILLGSTFGR